MVEIRPGTTSTLVEIEGVRFAQPQEITFEQLKKGVTVTLADAIVVCLHLVETPVLRGPSFGLVGNRDAMKTVRRQIDNVVDLNMSGREPFLIVQLAGRHRGGSLDLSSLRHGCAHGSPVGPAGGGASPP